MKKLFYTYLAKNLCFFPFVRVDFNFVTTNIMTPSVGMVTNAEPTLPISKAIGTRSMSIDGNAIVNTIPSITAWEESRGCVLSSSLVPSESVVHFDEGLVVRG